MRKTITETSIGPYSDGSGHRYEAKAIWHRDEANKTIAAHVEVSSPGGSDNRVVIGFDEWAELRHAIDTAIADTGYEIDKPRT